MALFIQGGRGGGGCDVKTRRALYIKSHLDRHAEHDQEEVGRGQAGQEDVGDRLHPSVAGYGENDERVAYDPQEKREAVDKGHRDELLQVEGAHRHVVVVVVLLGVVGAVGRPLEGVVEGEADEGVVHTSRRRAAVSSRVPRAVQVCTAPSRGVSLVVAVSPLVSETIECVLYDQRSQGGCRPTRHLLYIIFPFVIGLLFFNELTPVFMSYVFFR